MPVNIPRRTVYSVVGAILGLGLLAHGYSRPGLQVIGQKEVEVKLPPDPGFPDDGPVPAWVEMPPTSQTVVEDFTAIIPEREAMVRVTVGAIARTADGALMVSEMNEGSPRCPT